MKVLTYGTLFVICLKMPHMRNALLFFLVVSSCLSLNAQDRKAYINTKGEVVFEVPDGIKYAYDFEDGMARIKGVATVNGKRDWYYGYLDLSGKIAIPLQFNKVNDFASGAAAVQLVDGKYYIINKRGERIQERGFDRAGKFFDGMCEVCDKASTGGYHCSWVDSTGKLILPLEYLGGTYSEGLVATAKVGGTGVAEYGFLDKKGKVVIPFQFRQAGSTSFKNGLARVQRNGKTGLIDKTGKFVVEPKYGTLNSVGEGLFAIGFGNFSDFKFYDFDYNLVIPGPFDGVDPFEGGYAVVSDENYKSGLINKKGEYIFPIEYDGVYNDVIDRGLIVIQKDDNWQYLGPDGGEHPMKGLTWAGNEHEGELIPYRTESTGDKMGYMTKEGEMVIEPMFCKAGGFSKGGLALVTLCDGVRYLTGDRQVGTAYSNDPEEESTSDSWQSFSFDQARFDVSLPGEPTIEAPEEGTKGQYQSSVKLVSGDDGYIITYQELPSDVKAKKALELSETIGKNFIEQIGATITDERDISEGDMKVHEFDLEKNGVYYHTRVYVQGNDSWMLVFLNVKGKKNSEQEKKFLNSFDPRP